MGWDPARTPKSVSGWFLGPLEHPRTFFQAEKKSKIFRFFPIFDRGDPMKIQNFQNKITSSKNGLRCSKGPKNHPETLLRVLAGSQPMGSHIFLDMIHFGQNCRRLLDPKNARHRGGSGSPAMQNQKIGDSCASSRHCKIYIAKFTKPQRLLEYQRKARCLVLPLFLNQSSHAAANICVVLNLSDADSS